MTYGTGIVGMSAEPPTAAGDMPRQPSDQEEFLRLLGMAPGDHPRALAFMTEGELADATAAERTRIQGLSQQQMAQELEDKHTLAYGSENRMFTIAGQSTVPAVTMLAP